MNPNYHYTLILLFLFPMLTFAQKGTEVGAFVGIAQYQGDLAPFPVAASETNLALGGLYRYLFSSNLALRGTFTWGQISGDDRNRDSFRPGQREWVMKNNIMEMAVHAEWIFFGSDRYSNTGLHERQYSPFVALGLGASFTNARLEVPTEDRSKIPESEATSTFLVVPISAGLRLDITQDFLLSAEFGTRATFSDYIDGVSQNGNPDKGDWYFFAGISLVYVLDELVGSKAGR